MSKNKKISIMLSVLFTGITCAFFFIMASRAAKEVLNSMIESQIENLATNVQNFVEAYNYSNFATIHIAATIPIIKDPAVSIKEKAEQLFGVKDADSNLVGLNITDLKGNSYLVEGPMYNFSERAYFKNALQGKETVFGPINNKVTNIPTIFYGAPLYDIEGNLINTFFLAAHGETLSKICEQNKIGADGHAVIIRRSTGLVIADIDSQTVLKKNIYDDAADSGVKALQEISAKVASGEKGFDFVELPDGEILVSAYAPIKGTDWSVIVKANYADFTSSLNNQRVSMLLFSLLMIALSAVVPLLLIREKKD